jgi:hypothetical protein
VAGGTDVILEGANLTGATVTVGGASASITAATETPIKFTTPAGTVGAKDVVVTTPGGTATIGFTYIGPTITKLDPNSGSMAGGDTVTLTGTRLTGTTSVTVDGILATNITVVSDTQITFITPEGWAPVATTVTVTTPGGETVKSGAFTYVAKPTISSLLPNRGPLAGGTTVILTGTNLTGATSVSVGGSPAKAFSVNSATQITFTAPQSAIEMAMPADVEVITPGGRVISFDAFTYVAEPTISSLTPNQGPLAGGTGVTLTGTNLTGAIVIVDKTRLTSITVDSDTQIRFTTPAGAAGAADVVVTTPSGTATSVGGFTYVRPPTITGLFPNQGPMIGGTEVYLEGENLTGASVTVGGTPATDISVLDVTLITFQTPRGAAGAKDVVVTTPGGTVTKNNGFTYVAPPTLISLSPSSGPAAGGTVVTLTGTDLIDVTDLILFGYLFPFTVDNDTQITFTTPIYGDAVPKEVNVTVRTKYGESNSLKFLYDSAPAPALLTLAASPDMTTEETGAPDSSENKTPDGMGEGSGEGATPQPAEGGSTPPPDASQHTDDHDAPGGSAEGANDGQGETAVSPPPDGQGTPPANGQDTPPPNGQGAPPLGGQGAPPPEGQGAPPPEGQGAPPPEGQGAPSAASQPVGAVTRLAVPPSTAWMRR